ncbi:hypothetical protein P885DRAFT_81435 [Corynascus similis CBS 632.67]
MVAPRTTLYFQNVHDGAPMLHQGNYMLALRLPSHMRPPMCLQYIVMALAAATSDFYRHLSEDTQGAPYWQRLRQIDANLVTLAAALPETLDPSRNPHSLDAILVHTCTHIATIHLHRTVLRRHRQPVHAPLLVPAAVSHARLLPAAEGILTVFHAAGAFLGAALQNPLLPFAAYLAASVFLENHVRALTSASLSSATGEVETTATPGQAAPLGRAGGSGGRWRHEEGGTDKNSEDKLGYLARVLVAFGRSSPLVRTNAL